SACSWCGRYPGWATREKTRSWISTSARGRDSGSWSSAAARRGPAGAGETLGTTAVVWRDGQFANPLCRVLQAILSAYVHRIGRIDPESGAYELIDTPFPAPRRLRFDAKGNLWIPSFSAGLVARFNPTTREFRTWKLPTEPEGTETPYALNVERTTGRVWI